MNDPKKHDFPKSIDLTISDFRLSKGTGQIYLSPEKANLASGSVSFGIKKKYFITGVKDNEDTTVTFRKGSLKPKDINKIQNVLNNYQGRIDIDFSYIETNIKDLIKEKVPEYYNDGSNLNILSVPVKDKDQVGFCIFGINMTQQVVDAMKFEKGIKIKPKKVNLLPNENLKNNKGVKYYYTMTQVSDGTNTFDVEVLCAYVFFNGNKNSKGNDISETDLKKEYSRVLNLSKNFAFNKNTIESSIFSSNSEVGKIINNIKRELELGHYAEMIIVGYASASKVPTKQFKSNEILAQTRAANTKDAMVSFVGDQLATYMEDGTLIVRSGIKKFKDREWVTGLDYYSAKQWTSPDDYPKLSTKINQFKKEHSNFRIFKDGKYSTLTKSAKVEYLKYQKVKLLVLYNISNKKV